MIFSYKKLSNYQNNLIFLFGKITTHLYINHSFIFFQLNISIEIMYIFVLSMIINNIFKVCDLFRSILTSFLYISSTYIVLTYIIDNSQMKHLIYSFIGQ